MTHKTRGIVLRSIKYGETSLVITMFTELFGVQTYIVNGARTSKKSGNKSAQWQAASLLDMEVYHSDLKTMNRIKESSWAVLYQEIFSDVIKNSVAVYMVEMLYKMLKQPEQNADLFYFCEDVFSGLDKCSPTVAANVPLYFALHLSHFFGFRISDDLSEGTMYLDLQEGTFSDVQPAHPHFISGDDALVVIELLRSRQLNELENIKLNSTRRRYLLNKFHEYYSLHIHDFGRMKTLDVLTEILG